MTSKSLFLIGPSLIVEIIKTYFKTRLTTLESLYLLFLASQAPPLLFWENLWYSFREMQTLIEKIEDLKNKLLALEDHL